MRKILLLTLLFCFSIGTANAAVSWSNQQQKDNKKKADVWSRFDDAELCEKISLSAKGSSMRRMLNDERRKRRLKC